jgi:hypothetical protein
MCQPRSKQSAFSSRPNWDSPTPSPAGECVPPPFGSGRCTHSLGGEGVGGPNSDEGTDNVLLEVGIQYMYFEVSTVAGRCTEVEFINVHFVEVYGHNFESYQT